ncbi:MAG: nucleotide sugar dehydrogenase [Thermoplasmata archaeon]
MTSRSSSGPTVGIVGVGYMGIATGLAFARRGRRVFAYDVNPRVRAALRSGHSPYREDGLEPLLQTEIRRGRFNVVDGADELANQAQCIFLCLPTPSGRGGRVDLAPLRAGIRELGSTLRSVRGYRLVVVKSTVVPGTTQTVVEPLLRRATGKGPDRLGIAANPEFLSEGRMVRDALRPERIVVGVTDAESLRRFAAAYRGFDAPILKLSPSGAELVKYASNAFLALKVSFANELSHWTENLGGNIDEVVAAVGADPRIGRAFLRAGPGFGGSCFDKDLRAFLGRAESLGIRFRSAETALAINREQTDHSFGLIREAAGALRRKSVAVLGLAFKAGTDDVRESRAFPIVERLLGAGARVRVHDPVALRNFRREWLRRPGFSGGQVAFCPSIAGALRGTNLAVIQADWPDYLDWPLRWTRSMRVPLVVDLRRALSPSVIERARLKVVALGVGPAKGNPLPARAATRARRRR